MVVLVLVDAKGNSLMQDEWVTDAEATKNQKPNDETFANKTGKLPVNTGKNLKQRRGQRLLSNS